MKKFELRAVKKIKTNPDYSIECTFDNGEVKHFDMSFIKKIKTPMVAPLKKYSYFKQVFIEMGTPTWPNGYDICSDLIYKEGTEKRKQKNAA